jgi:hypothetical protein
MRLKHYHETQNDRWHEQYLESQRLINDLEEAIRQIEAVALDHITDPSVRDEIMNIVNHVWRGARA